MAASTRVTEQIETFLDIVLAETRELPIIEAEWDTLPDGNRASFGLEWAHWMADYLTLLHEHRCAGDMTPDQQDRYRTLLRELAAALPIIERLNLYRPPVPLDA